MKIFIARAFMLRVRAGEGAPGGNHVSAGRPALLFINSGKANVFGFCFFSLVAAAESYPPPPRSLKGARPYRGPYKKREFSVFASSPIGSLWLPHKREKEKKERKGKKRKKKKREKEP